MRRKNFWGRGRRIYVGNLLARIVEFIISLYVIGYIIAASINPKISVNVVYLLLALSLAGIMLILGIIITPPDD